MIVTPVDLQSITTHQLGARGPERPSIHFQGAGSRGLWRSRLGTGGARAPIAQALVRVGAQVAVQPLNGERAVFSRQLDLLGNDLHEIVLCPWPLVLCSWSSFAAVDCL